MKVIVCGSRTWRDQLRIGAFLAGLPQQSLVITGGAGGADSIALTLAERMGHQVKQYLPNWDAWGKRAGPIRNRQMLGEKPDLVAAFWDGKSRGTMDMITIAKDAGVPVEVFSP